MTASPEVLPRRWMKPVLCGILVHRSDGAADLRSPVLRDVVMTLAPPAEIRAAHRRAADAAPAWTFRRASSWTI